MDVSVRLCLLLVLLLIGGCARSEEDQLRDAAERYREAFADRDFAAVWNLLDRGSRQTFLEQRRSFMNLKKTDALYDTVWTLIRDQYGLEREQVEQMDARDWFIAVYEGGDRVRPELREAQIAEARGTSVKEITVEGNQGETRVRLPSSKERVDFWTKEAGAWKVTASFGSLTQGGS